jgi:hypothetical protein
VGAILRVSTNSGYLPFVLTKLLRHYRVGMAAGWYSWHLNLAKSQLPNPLASLINVGAITKKRPAIYQTSNQENQEKLAEINYLHNIRSK